MPDTSVQLRDGMLRSSKCIGAKVVNPEGETLGRIEDLVIDPYENQVAAAVVSFGGFLGIGEKLVPIPLSALSYDTREQRFLINVDKETLRNGPAFRHDAWPALMDRVWAADLYSYYGYPPYWS
jgi:sporulation protein YlmC with PRC-barrel domain